MDEDKIKDNELIKCKSCEAKIPKKIKNCPECNTDQRGFFMRHKITTFVLILMLIAFMKDIANLVNHEDTKKVEPTIDLSEEFKVPNEYKAALEKADLYSSTMGLSKNAIYEQLISDNGEGFSEEAVEYAMEYVAANWENNALVRAKGYQETMSMSNKAIYEQLVSEEGFTEEEAQYAIDNLE